MAERYNTPAEGTLDWHVPLNQNFEDLDIDIEVRDRDSNRSNYSPKEGSKFLATDTGNVYIGNGSDWNSLGNIGSSGGGVSLAQPGNVQSAIDAAAGTHGGGVFLDPTKTYVQPSSPWEVKENVTLHFNGAWMVGDGSRDSTDFIHLHPGGLVVNPRIDLYDGGNAYTPDNNYNANVFVCDTKYGEYFANGTGIRNGLIKGETDGGTGLYLNVSQNETFITHNRFELTIDNAREFRNYSSIGTAVYMNTGDGLDDAWINGVHIYGHWKNPKRGWIMDGDSTAGGEGSTLNQINYNTARVQYQPDNVNNTSEEMWWIKSDTWAKRNIWHGMIWDLYQSDAVRIDSTYNNSASRACTDNAANCQNGFDLFYNGKHITNNSPREFYVNDLTSWSHDEY